MPSRHRCEIGVGCVGRPLEQAGLELSQKSVSVFFSISYSLISFRLSLFRRSFALLDVEAKGNSFTSQTFYPE